MVEEELHRLNKRFGKHISTKPIKLADDLEDRLRKSEEWINFLSPGSERFEREAKSLEKQKEIVRIIHSAMEEDFPLTYMDIYGILALRHGLEEQVLIPYAVAMGAAARKGLINSEGSGVLRNVLYHGLLSKISQYVATKFEPFTFQDTVRELDTSDNKFHRDMVNHTLNLLDTIHEVVKLPVNSGMTGGPVVWINPELRNSEQTIPYWNIKYRILLVLGETDSASKSDLAQDTRISELVSVRSIPNAYSSARIERALDDLVHFGLLSSGTEYRRRRVRIYSIVPEAKEAVNLTEEQRFLDENLRKSLLGEKYFGLTPTEQFTLEKIRRIGRIFALWRQSGYDLIASIGESRSYAEGIIRGRRDPLRDLKVDTLTSKYFPFLDAPEREGISFYLERRN